MGIVKPQESEIIAYRVAKQIVCGDCMNREELDEVSEDDIMLESEQQDDFIFCDRCKEQCSR